MFVTGLRSILQNTVQVLRKLALRLAFSSYIILLSSSKIFKTESFSSWGFEEGNNVGHYNEQQKKEGGLRAVRQDHA